MQTLNRKSTKLTGDLVMEFSLLNVLKVEYSLIFLSEFYTNSELSKFRAVSVKISI